MAWEKREGSRQLPKDWQAIRRRVISRDQYQCVWCGAKEQLEVDHIGSNDDHSLTNLRTLCKPCHQPRSLRQAAAARYAPHLVSRRPQERHPGDL